MFVSFSLFSSDHQVPMVDRDNYQLHQHDAASWRICTPGTGLQPKETKPMFLSSVFPSPLLGRPLKDLRCLTTSNCTLQMELQDQFPSFSRTAVCGSSRQASQSRSDRLLYPLAELEGSTETDGEAKDAQDALIFSDADVVREQKRKHGGMPLPETNSCSTESVGSGGVGMAVTPQPVKKKWKRSSVSRNIAHKPCDDNDVESCCIGDDVDVQENAPREEEMDSDVAEDLRRRRERIQETVSALQKILPDSVGKDAVAVLDEAICYLKYLKLKAKALGSTSL